MDFDYFYDFLGGETDQWTPYLFRDNTQVFPWIGKPGYNHTTTTDPNLCDFRNSYRAKPVSSLTDFSNWLL